MRKHNVVVAFALIAAGLVAGQQSAQARPEQVYPKCSFGVPTRLAYTQPDQDIRFSIGSGCPATLHQAVWWNMWPQHYYDVACNHEFCHVPLDYTRVGIMTQWNGDDAGGTDIKGNKVADLLPARSMTKLGSAVKLNGARRTATTTTLTAQPTYYSVGARKYVRHHGKVLFQKRDLGTSTWKDMGYATPNSAGVATFTVATARSRDYRAFVAETTTAWYAYSPTKRV